MKWYDKVFNFIVYYREKFKLDIYLKIASFMIISAISIITGQRFSVSSVKRTAKMDTL